MTEELPDLDQEEIEAYLHNQLQGDSSYRVKTLNPETESIYTFFPEEQTKALSDDTSIDHVNVKAAHLFYQDILSIIKAEVSLWGVTSIFATKAKKALERIDVGPHYLELVKYNPMVEYYDRQRVVDIRSTIIRFPVMNGKANRHTEMYIRVYSEPGQLVHFRNSSYVGPGYWKAEYYDEGPVTFTLISEQDYLASEPTVRPQPSPNSIDW